MTRDEKIARAKALKAKGYSRTAIAGSLGVGTTTVAVWLNPALAERDRVRSRETKRRRKALTESSGAVCRECRIDLLGPSDDGLCGFCRDELVAA